MSRALLASFFAAFAAAASLAVAACDPVHTQQIDALGGEPAGVRNGPTHRPGQPCLVCHDGTLGNPSQFTVAGTVYQRASDTTGLQGVTVTLTGSNGATTSVTTNQAGNFYLKPSDFMPSFPMQATIAYGGQTVQMQTLIGRDGSCAGCHVDPAGADSPGRVAFTLEDGGTPP